MRVLVSRSVPDGQSDRRRERQLWWWLFACFAAMLVAWAFETPLLAGTDEPSHAIRAEAIVRGQLVGDSLLRIGGIPIASYVRVPEAFRHSNRSDCFELHPNRTPACAPAFRGGQRRVRAITNQYRSPPAYYAVVGVPTLLLPSAAGVYVMRILGALACAALLASALLSARRLRHGGIVVVAVLAAMTPEAFHLGGLVNANGLEIAAAVCVWSTVAAIVLGPSEPTPRLITRVGVAVVVLILARGLSPLFAVAAVVAVVALGQRDRLLSVLRRADTLRWLLASVVAGVVAAAWLLYIKFQYPLNRPGSGLVHAIDQTPRYLREAVGVFSFRSAGVFSQQDIGLPGIVYVAWALAIGVLVVVALAVSSRRQAAVLLAITAAGFALPVLVEGLSIPPIGVPWVGRHGLPLLAGIPIVAATVVTMNRRPSGPPRARRIGIAVLVLVTVGQVVAFGAAVQRWAVGGAGSANPIRFLFDPVWSPPVPSALLLVVFLAGLGGLTAVAGDSLRRDPALTSAPPRDLGDAVGTPR
jgi:Predicted membrane protein (DUF2142)